MRCKTAGRLLFAQGNLMEVSTGGQGMRNKPPPPFNVASCIGNPNTPVSPGEIAAIPAHHRGRRQMGPRTPRQRGLCSKSKKEEYEEGLSGARRRLRRLRRLHRDIVGESQTWIIRNNACLGGRDDMRRQ